MSEIPENIKQAAKALLESLETPGWEYPPEAWEKDVDTIGRALLIERHPHVKATGKHECEGELPKGGYGGAVEICWEEEDGSFWAGNGEYSSQVAFCPYCGTKAPRGPIMTGFATPKTSSTAVAATKDTGGRS